MQLRSYSTLANSNGAGRGDSARPVAGVDRRLSPRCNGRWLTACEVDQFNLFYQLNQSLTVYWTDTFYMPASDGGWASASHAVRLIPRNRRTHCKQPAPPPTACEDTDCLYERRGEATRRIPPRMRTHGEQQPSEQGDTPHGEPLTAPPLGSHESIRQYVNQKLCELENLEPDHFPLSERTLERAGSPCGVMFVLHGPRQLQVSAVWEIDRNQIWFYNAIGERCHQTQLCKPVAVESSADRYPASEVALATAG